MTTAAAANVIPPAGASPAGDKPIALRNVMLFPNGRRSAETWRVGPNLSK